MNKDVLEMEGVLGDFEGVLDAEAKKLDDLNSWVEKKQNNMLQSVMDNVHKIKSAYSKKSAEPKKKMKRRVSAIDMLGVPPVSEAAEVAAVEAATDGEGDAVTAGLEGLMTQMSGAVSACSAQLV